MPLASLRLLVLIAGPVLAAFVPIGVGLACQRRQPKRFMSPGAAEAVDAPRVAHRRMVARARVRVWLETLSVRRIAVAG